MADDIYKILSRSTKLPKGAKSATAPTRPSHGGGAVPRPSAGGLQPVGYANLHTSPTGIQGTGKRKRGHVASAIVDKDGDIDFFGSGEVQPTVAWRDPNSLPDNDEGGRKSGYSHGELDAESRPWTTELCKRELQKHKVKVTVLEDWDTSSSPIPRGKKRSKTQLYPQPLVAFGELSSRYSLSPRLLGNINAQGYTVPTQVQLASIPLLLDKEGGAMPDLLSVAPTGSGKTLAFLIPIMDSVMRIRKQSRSTANAVEPADDAEAESGPLAVVLAPTKELASQIVNEGRKMASNTGVKVTLMKKGMSVLDRAAIGVSSIETAIAHAESEAPSGDAGLTSGKRVKAHILVSTPLVLLHAITSSDGSVVPLPTVRHLVLDEADVLLDPLFRDQVLSIWSACSHLDNQVSMWSATMGSNIEALAQTTIAARHRALTLTEAPQKRLPLLRLVVGLKDTALPSVTHKLIYAATEAGKLMAVRQLLRPTAPSSSAQKGSPSNDVDVSSLQPPFLIFTQTVARANALAAELKYDVPPSAGGPSRIAALHSDLSDAARDTVMSAFRKGDVWVLITTDLLARGVDFRGVNGVVNYDMPTSVASYIHRAGRTGRAGREGGIAVTLYADEDVPFLKPVANVIAMSDNPGGSGTADVRHWLLGSLPTPTKREKKTFKQRGLEVRRPGGEKARISTKSGFQRKLEQRRRDARGAVLRDRKATTVDVHSREAEREQDEFDGFDD